MVDVGAQENNREFNLVSTQVEEIADETRQVFVKSDQIVDHEMRS